MNIILYVIGNKIFPPFLSNSLSRNNTTVYLSDSIFLWVGIPWICKAGWVRPWLLCVKRRYSKYWIFLSNILVCNQYQNYYWTSWSFLFCSFSTLFVIMAKWRISDINIEEFYMAHFPEYCEFSSCHGSESSFVQHVPPVYIISLKSVTGIRLCL